MDCIFPQWRCRKYMFFHCTDGFLTKYCSPFKNEDVPSFSYGKHEFSKFRYIFSGDVRSKLQNGSLKNIYHAATNSSLTHLDGKILRREVPFEGYSFRWLEWNVPMFNIIQSHAIRGIAGRLANNRGSSSRNNIFPAWNWLDSSGESVIWVLDQAQGSRIFVSRDALAV